MNELMRQLPKMKSGMELKELLTVLPEYDEVIRSEDSGTRLMALSDMYQIYIPFDMAVEIYSKLYLSILHSLQKKMTNRAVIQGNENYKRSQNRSYNGIIGGSDSFTIIGASGIGKSSAIMRAISLISENQWIELEKPYIKVIPCVICQCPHDCSVKGLLLEILRQVDCVIGSNYYDCALRARATTDMLIGSVSQTALNHIGV